MDDDDARLSSSDRQGGLTGQNSGPSASDAELLLDDDDARLSSSDSQRGTGQSRSAGTSASDAELVDDDDARLSSSDSQEGTGQSSISGTSASDEELSLFDDDDAWLNSSNRQIGTGRQSSCPSAEQSPFGRDSDHEEHFLKNRLKELEGRVHQLERRGRSHNSVTRPPSQHLRQERSESEEGEFSGTLSNAERRKLKRSFRSVPYMIPRQTTRKPEVKNADKDLARIQGLIKDSVGSLSSLLHAMDHESEMPEDHMAVPVMNSIRLLGKAFHHIFKLKSKNMLKAVNLQDLAEQPDKNAALALFGSEFYAKLKEQADESLMSSCNTSYGPKCQEGHPFDSQTDGGQASCRGKTIRRKTTRRKYFKPSPRKFALRSRC